jgi:S-formylglutathione hydrolase
VTGRTWRGTAFGGARGRTDVPKIVDWYMQGKIEIDPMITHTMPLDKINEGFDLMHTFALKHPDRFKSCSAFAPIVQPSSADWSRPALEKYLGSDEAAWRRHDATQLIEDGARFPEFLVDQGTADGFLDNGLRPWLLEDACRGTGIELTLRMQEGYDHSYNFISTFMDDHLAWHAKRLG